MRRAFFKAFTPVRRVRRDRRRFGAATRFTCRFLEILRFLAIGFLLAAAFLAAALRAAFRALRVRAAFLAASERLRDLVTRFTAAAFRRRRFGALPIPRFFFHAARAAPASFRFFVRRLALAFVPPSSPRFFFHAISAAPASFLFRLFAMPLLLVTGFLLRIRRSFARPLARARSCATDTLRFFTERLTEGCEARFCFTCRFCFAVCFLTLNRFRGLEGLM